jgi:hypothetical protein
MRPANLTDAERQVLEGLEARFEYEQAYRGKAKMGRVIIKRETLTHLRRACKELGVRHTSVASLLIVGHNHSVNQDSISWLKELDLIPVLELAVLSVSAAASRVAMQMGRTLGCRKGSVATAILIDCLPILETMPETIPGIKSLIRYPTRTRRNVGLYRGTRDRISARCRQMVERGEDKMTVAEYIRSCLITIQSADIVGTFESDEFAEALGDMNASDGYTAIAVDLGLWEFLKELGDHFGCSVTKLVSFFMEKELQATERELIYETQILPLDPIKRWKSILEHYIRTGI